MAKPETLIHINGSDPVPKEIAAALIVQTSLDALTKRLDVLINLLALDEESVQTPIRDESGRIVQTLSQRKKSGLK